MITKFGALFLIILFHLPATGQSDEEKSLPENFWELMGTCVKSEKFDFLRDHFAEPEIDALDNLVFREFDYSIEFFFRPNTRHLNQIRVDLDYYDGPVILGLHKHITRRQMKKLLRPVQILNYGSGSYMIGEHYSVLAAFEGWPVRKLIRFTLVYEGEYTADRDMDGVADSIDRCPDEVGTEACNGCPATYCTTLPDTIWTNGFAQSFCGLLHTLSQRTAGYEELISGPSSDADPLPHRLNPHRLYEPAISIPYFTRAFIVESVEGDRDTVFSLELITEEMAESEADSMLHRMANTVLRCGSFIPDVPGIEQSEKSFSVPLLSAHNGPAGLITFRVVQLTGTDRYQIVVSIGLANFRQQEK